MLSCQSTPLPSVCLPAFLPACLPVPLQIPKDPIGTVSSSSSSSLLRFAYRSCQLPSLLAAPSRHTLGVPAPHLNTLPACLLPAVCDVPRLLPRRLWQLAL